jgi:branched-chain amino acid aminotransferase
MRETSAMTDLASLDGRVLPLAEARVPVTDEGLLRGDGVFEVLRVYGGRPYALAEHLERMERSAANLRLPFETDAVRRDAEALLAEAKPGDVLLRLVATRGGHRIALLEPLPEHPAGVRLGTITYSPTRVLDGIKSLSYAGNMLATRVAKERGFDEALLVTPHGRVLEAPTSSFFWARDGRLLTPPLDEHILASITRTRLMELADAEEAPCTREDLDAAEEAFLASTVREVQPVTVIDERELPGARPLTLAAAEALRERIAAELEAG